MGSIGCRRQQLIAAAPAARLRWRCGDVWNPVVRIAVRFRLVPAGLIFASLAACSGGFSNSDSNSATPTAAIAKPTINLSPNPSRVQSGGGATLVWSASGADQCIASGAWSGQKGTYGSEPVTELTADSMYMLTCRGPGGEASQSAEIVVTSPAPAVTLTASATTIAAGGKTLLTWNALNATTCAASGAWSGTLGPSGSLSTGALASTAAYTLTCTGAGGSASQTTTVTVGSLPPLLALNANPTSVVSGQAAQLTWASENATSCVASGGWSGTEAAAGVASTGPLTANTTFTVTCTGPGGSATQSAAVTVTAAVPTVGIVARPSTVLKGQAAVLSWSSLNTSACSASGGWSGAKGLAGSQTTGPLSATTTYSVTCTGPGGTATQSTTVTAATSANAPSVSLSVGPSAISSGGTSTLSWSAANATSCVASGAWAGTKSVSGSQSTGALANSATYVLTCTGPSGTASQSATVSVTAPLPAVSFTASPSTVVTGKGATLSWSVTNATSCSAGGAWSGAKAGSGSFPTGPLTSDTSYALSCTGTGGTSTKTVTVSVVGATPTVSLTANPTTIKAGGTANLQWTASNATSCTASGGWTGTKASSGSQTTVALSATTNFTLACSGSGGSASQSVTVTVAAAAPGVSLLANPTSVASGASSVLTWSSSNASSCIASGGWNGTLAPAGSQSTGPLTKTTTFTIKCSGAAGSATQSTIVLVAPGSTGNGTATLSWSAPTKNTDGSPVAPLAGYRIYYGTAPNVLTQSVTISNPSTLSFQVTGLSSGTWYFVVAADATDGSESAVSTMVSKTI